MLIKEIFLVALAAIRANLLRSFLTCLGIIIGVGAVITMVALGEGASARVEAQIQSMGTDVLTIRAQQSRDRGVASGNSARLYIEDAEALRNELGSELTIAPQISSRMQVSMLRWNTSNDVLGTWPEYADIYELEPEFGRFFDESEVQGRRRVAVLGSGLPEELNTPAALLVGRDIRIGSQTFEVIGVLAEKGTTAFVRPDDTVFVPFSTAQYRLFGGADRLQSISAKVNAGPEEMDRAFDLIDPILRREHRIAAGQDADYDIGNPTDLLESFQETSQIFTMLLAGIAGVSLLVGGIGIMNIMLVSVTERTREIGIRKALGATRTNIMLQFVTEALVLCVLGGAVGVAVGAAGARLAANLGDWSPSVSPMAVFVALAFSAGIGLFFGIWPAQRAAKLDAIVALRYE